MNESEIKYWKNLSDNRYWDLALMTIRGIMKMNANWYNVTESHIQRKIKQIKNAKTDEQRRKALNISISTDKHHGKITALKKKNYPSSRNQR